MHLYKTLKGSVALHNDQSFLIDGDWDSIINRDNLFEYLHRLQRNLKLRKQYHDCFFRWLLNKDMSLMCYYISHWRNLLYVLQY